jgi:hypothetical protein
MPALILAWKRRWALGFPAILVITALASYTLTVTAARFAFPFEPIQLALAGGMIALLLPDPDRVRDSNSPRRGFEPVTMPRMTQPAMSH